MFTGIVSGTGTVAEAGGGRLAIEHATIARRVAIGSSVSVNGACVTVVEVSGDVFRADVVPETGRRTNLGRLRSGDQVNLELPLAAEQLLDGHVLQGHVDATARIQAVRAASPGVEVVIELPAELSRYVAEKGSIGVDGMSLTVAALDDDASTFTVALIPHTLEITVAGKYASGSLVNIEVDVLARYLERLVRERTQPGIK